MALVLADRVKESCSSPGTGTVTLLGAQTEYQSFSAGIGANNTTYYVIADQSGSNWEVGLGTVGSGGTTLARTTVLSSSNSGSLVNFASGTQDVWVDYPASKAVTTDIGTATKATNLAGGAASQIPYQTGSGATSFISNGTSGQVLTSNGTSAPTWNNRTQYLGVLLNGGTTTQVPTSNGYLGVLLNGGSTTQVPIN
jgi:hypothetical protein